MMIGSRSGLLAALAIAALAGAGSEGSFEPSRPRTKLPAKSAGSFKAVQRSGNKLAKRKARGKQLFRP